MKKRKVFESPLFIPYEIWTHVFSFLLERERRGVERCCDMFYNITHRPSIISREIRDFSSYFGPYFKNRTINYSERNKNAEEELEKFDLSKIKILMFTYGGEQLFESIFVLIGKYFQDIEIIVFMYSKVKGLRMKDQNSHIYAGYTKSTFDIVDGEPNTPASFRHLKQIIYYTERYRQSYHLDYFVSSDIFSNCPELKKLIGLDKSSRTCKTSNIGHNSCYGCLVRSNLLINEQGGFFANDGTTVKKCTFCSRHFCKKCESSFISGRTCVDNKGICAFCRHKFVRCQLKQHKERVMLQYKRNMKKCHICDCYITCKEKPPKTCFGNHPMTWDNLFKTNLFLRCKNCKGTSCGYLCFKCNEFVCSSCCKNCFDKNNMLICFVCKHGKMFGKMFANELKEKSI